MSSTKFVRFPMDWKIRWSEFYSIKNRPFVEKRIVTSFNNVPIRWYVRVQEETKVASGLECFFCYIDGPMEKIDGQNGIELEICMVDGDGTIGAVQTLKLEHGMDSGWYRLFDNDFTNVRGKCDSTSKTTGDTDRFVLQLTIKIPIKIFSFTMPPGPTPKPCAPWLIKLFKTINDPEPSRFADAKLLSRDEVVFYCHRNVIAAQSEPLAKIFRDGTEDDQDQSAVTKATNNYTPSSVESNATYESALSVLEDESITTVIESASSAVVETVSKKRKEDEYYDIPSMGAASLESMVEYLYTGKATMSTLSVTELIEVADAGKAYALKSLRKWSGGELWQRVVDEPGMAFEIARFADRSIEIYDELDLLKYRAFDVIVEHREEWSTTSELPNLFGGGTNGEKLRDDFLDFLADRLRPYVQP